MAETADPAGMPPGMLDQVIDAIVAEHGTVTLTVTCSGCDFGGVWATAPEVKRAVHLAFEHWAAEGEGHHVDTELGDGSDDGKPVTQERALDEGPGSGGDVDAVP